MVAAKMTNLKRGEQVNKPLLSKSGEEGKSSKSPVSGISEIAPTRTALN